MVLVINIGLEEEEWCVQLDYNVSEYYKKTQWLWRSVKQYVTDNSRKLISSIFIV